MVVPLRASLLLAAPLFLASLPACGPAGDTGAGGSGGGDSGGSGGDGAGPPTLRVVPGVPELAAGDPPDRTAFTIDGYASAAASRNDLTVIGTSVGAYEAKAAGPSWLPIVGDEPDLPLETGIVRAAAAYDTGIVLATDTGLFYAADGVLTRSAGHDALFPLQIRGIAGRIADDDGDGTDSTYLTLRTDAGLVEQESGSLVQWTVGDETGAPSGALGRKDIVFAAWGNRVYEVDKAAKVAYPLVFDIGHVADVACASQACDPGAVIVFATDKGLVERSPSGEYTLYTLTTEGSVGDAITTFALDPTTQRLYAHATSGALLRLRAGNIPERIADIDPSDLPVRAAVDGQGDVWIATGGDALHLATGTPLSFATDIQPIMGEYCAPCHKTGTNGAPKIDFESYDEMVPIAEKALMRIQDGSMPLPGWPAVPKEQVKLIATWVVTKAP